MTNDEMARKAAEINFEIVVAHGVVECKVGFVWRDTFIHNPFVDPQYGAFDVDTVQQYGDHYLNSIFVTDPAKALQIAQRQLRDTANEDIARYCVDRKLDVLDIIATIEAACGVLVPESDDLLETLTDEQLTKLWRRIEEIGKTTILDGN